MLIKVFVLKVKNICVDKWLAAQLYWPLKRLMHSNNNNNNNNNEEEEEKCFMRLREKSDFSCIVAHEVKKESI